MPTIYQFQMYECTHCHYRADRPFIAGDLVGCRGCSEGKGDCREANCPHCSTAAPLTVAVGIFSTTTVADLATCLDTAERDFYSPVETAWEQDIAATVSAQENLAVSRFSDGERQRRIDALRTSGQTELTANKALHLTANRAALATSKADYTARRLTSLAWCEAQVAAGFGTKVR